MRFRSTIFALAAALWSGTAERAWAIAGCDAFSAALRTEASDMQVEFGRAIVVSRTRSDSNVFDVTTQGRRRRDPELPRRRIPPLRGAHRRAGERPHEHEFRALSDRGAQGGAGMGRGQEPRRPARDDRGRARISRRLARARRRLCRRQDRGAPAWRRESRADGDRLRSHVRHRRPGGRVSEVRFHHLERRRVDEALPRILERALEEGRRVLVRAASERNGRRRSTSDCGPMTTQASCRTARPATAIRRASRSF